MEGNNLSIIGIIFILLILAIPFYYSLNKKNNDKIMNDYQYFETRKSNDNSNW